MNKRLQNKKLIDIKNLYDQYLKYKDMIHLLEENQTINVKYENGTITKIAKYKNKYNIDIENKDKGIKINNTYKWPDIKYVVDNLGITEGLIIEEY